jgi:hypothetical protein
VVAGITTTETMQSQPIRTKSRELEMRVDKKAEVDVSLIVVDAMFNSG